MMKKVLICLFTTALLMCVAANVRAFSFEPGASVDFGEVLLEETESKAVLIRNVLGTGSLQVIDVQLVDNDEDSFSSNLDLDPPIFIGGFSSYRFNVFFTPHSLGVKEAALLVSAEMVSGDDVGILWRDFRLELAGTGVDSISVPDASIILLLGSSLIGLVGFGRKSKRS
jgi:hypothetical protein